MKEVANKKNGSLGKGFYKDKMFFYFLKNYYLYLPKSNLYP
jgi:hypothetical protein